MLPLRQVFHLDREIKMDYFAGCSSEKTLSTLDMMRITDNLETDALNVFSGECLMGYLLAIRDIQLSTHTYKTTLSDSNGMEK